MSGTVEWQPKVAVETVYRYADFTDELATGEQISSSAVTSTVWSGNDPSPAAIVAGTSVLNNSAGIPAVVKVTLVAGIVGTIYQCVTLGTTASGRSIAKTASLAIVPPLN